MIEALYAHYLRHPHVSTDSRRCEAGDIFFALRGERFDGNAYAADVVGRGAALAVVDDPRVIPADVVGVSQAAEVGHEYGPYMLVPDVLSALQQLAAYHRAQFRHWPRPVTVVGITGTNGKTTTKELTHAVLSKRWLTLATQGNLNNQIGVPLTLLSVRPDHEMAIVEMGANHPDDIAELAAIARPDYGLITNVGKAHLLGFGSIEGVVAAKTQLYHSLRRDGGTAFIDRGNDLLTPHVEGMATVDYVPGEVVSCDPYLHVSLPTLGLDIPTHLIGAYNLANVRAAATVGHHFGVAAADIRAAIADYCPQNMRSQLIDLGMGRTLILDAYNANPTSMMAALSSFAQSGLPHKAVILGDMRELGDESLAEHVGLLRALTAWPKIATVLLVGSEMVRAYGALSERAPELLDGRQSVRCYDDVEALLADAEVLRRLAGATLVKGSRSMRLERVAVRLQSQA